MAEQRIDFSNDLFLEEPASANTVHTLHFSGLEETSQHPLGLKNFRRKSYNLARRLGLQANGLLQANALPKNTQSTPNTNETEVDQLIRTFGKNTPSYPGSQNWEELDKLEDCGVRDPFLSPNMEHEDNNAINFGVDKQEVMKEIETRMASKDKYDSGFLRRTKLSEAQTGLKLPLIASGVLLFFTISIMAGYSVYFRQNAITSLDDNIQRDASILSKITKEKEAEILRLKKELREIQIRNEAELDLLRLQAEEKFREQVMAVEENYRKQNLALSSQRTDSSLILKLKQEYLKNLEELQKQRDADIRKKEEETKKQNQQILEQQKHSNIKEMQKILNKVTGNPTAEAQNNHLQKNALEELERKISTAITASMNALQKGNRAEAMQQLSQVPLLYEKGSIQFAGNETFKKRMKADLLVCSILQDLSQKLTASMAQNSDLTGQASDYQKQWNIMEKKLQRFRNAYSSAKVSMQNANFPQAKQDFQNVLTEFQEMEDSSRQLLAIEKKQQNQLAKPLYDQALKMLQTDSTNKNAVRLLSRLLIQTPLSDFTQPAAEKLEELAMSGTSLESAEAGNLMKIANEAMQNKQYTQAITLFASALEQTKNTTQQQKCIAGIKQANELTKGVISAKFQIHCLKFRDAVQHKEYSSARDEYFKALEDAFSPYLDNSLAEFIAVENSFLAKENLEAMKTRLNQEYQLALKQQDETLRQKFQAQIDALTAEKSFLTEEYEKKLAEQQKNNEQTILSTVTARSKERREKLKNIADLETELAQLRNEIDERDKKIVLMEENAAELEKRAVERDIFSEKISELQQNIDAMEDEFNSAEKKRLETLNVLAEQKSEIERLQSRLSDSEEKLHRQEDEWGKQNLLLQEQDAKLQADAQELLLKKEEIEVLKLKLETQENFYHKSLLEANNQQKSLEEKYQALQQNQTTLVNKQKLQQKELEQLKQKNALLIKEIESWKEKYNKLPGELEHQYKLRLEDEKYRIQLEFNEKLNKISADVATGKKSSFEDMEPIAKVIEILNDRVTFQLNQQSLSMMINNGDQIPVVRDLGGNMISIGTLEITGVSSFSTFARGRISNLTPGMSFRSGDILVISKKK